MPYIKNIILNILKEWSNDTSGGMDGWWHGYESFQDQILTKYKVKISIKELKKYFKELKLAGLIEIRPTYNMAMELSGSGYFIKELK
jgi:hypothetical protein